MEISRVSDGEIVKNTEILPKFAGGDDDVWKVQVLHYLEPGESDESMIGDYQLRIYSEYGSGESVSTFSIVKSSMPGTVAQETVEELVTDEELVTEELVTVEEELDIAYNSEESESKIPSWVHDIFVWYANETISENELLAALEYLISQEINFDCILVIAILIRDSLSSGLIFLDNSE